MTRTGACADPENSVGGEDLTRLCVILFYQSPLILTELFQHNLINVSYLTACCLYQVMMTLHFFNDIANDAESTQNQKIRHNRCFEE